MLGNPPKILLLVTSSAWGGAERYVARLAEASAGAFEVLVAAGPSPRMELFEALRADVRRTTVPHLVHPIAPLRDLLALLEIRRLIDREGVDLVHCNSSKAGLLGALAAAASRRRPKVVFTAHGWGFLEGRSPAFRLLLLWSERLASRFRHATVVLSESERAVALSRKLARPESVHLIPHGIDEDEIAFFGRDEARAALERIVGTRLGSPLIGCLANFYPSKGLPVLFEAFDRLASTMPQAELAVLGEGPYRREVLAARDRAGHRDRIHLPGAVKDAARLLKAFDLFVLPSLKEGLPWALLEAALAGLPIVATKVGAVPELFVDGVEASLVAPGDPAALASAIRRLFDDRTLILSMTNGARQAAGRRSARRMLADTFSLWKRLLTAPAPERPGASR